MTSCVSGYNVMDNEARVVTALSFLISAVQTCYLFGCCKICVNAFSRFIVLPIYVAMLWAFTLMCGINTYLNFVAESPRTVTWTGNVTATDTDVGRAIGLSVSRASFFALIFFITALMLHSGAGKTALRNSILIGVVVLITLIVVTVGFLMIYINTGNLDLWVGLQMTLFAVISVGDLVVLCLPERLRASRRPATKYLITYNLFSHLFMVPHTYFQLYVDDVPSLATADCVMTIICVQGVYLYLFVLLFVMWRDSLFWQGADGSFDTPEGVVGPSSPLLPRDLARDLAVGAFDMLSGKGLDQRVPLLSAAALVIGDRIGGSADERPRAGLASAATELIPDTRLYFGKLYSESVAVKFITCAELGKREVRLLCHEAAQRARFSASMHVVALQGLCVRPPAVCYVMDLCRYGSIADVTRSPGAGAIPLTWRNRMLLALQAARGLLALHAPAASVGSGISHNSVSSHNFLVAAREDVAHDAHVDALYAPPRQAGERSARERDSVDTRGDDSDDFEFERLHGLQDRYISQPDVLDAEAQCGFVVKIADLDFSAKLAVQEEKADTDLAQRLRVANVLWSAPEVLREGSRAFSPAADCYGLGCVIFEIVYLRAPFAEELEQSGAEALAMQIMDHNYRPRTPLSIQVPSSVMFGSSGQSPQQSSANVLGTVGASPAPLELDVAAFRARTQSSISITVSADWIVDVRVIDLIRALWAADAAQRPSAQAVVDTLRDVLLHPSEDNAAV